MSKYDSKWLNNFEAYKDYVLKHNEIPKANQVWNNIKIGYWLNNQKTSLKNNRLEKGKLEKLDRFNILWRATRLDIHIQRKTARLDNVIEQAKMETSSDKTPLTSMYDIPKQLLKYAIDNGITSCEDIIMNSTEANYKAFRSDVNKVTLMAASAVYREIPISILRLIKHIKGSYKEISQLRYKDNIINEVQSALNNLNTRDKEVVELYFGFNNTKHLILEECGRHFGVTRERARQLLARATNELSRELFGSTEPIEIKGSIFGTLKVVRELINNKVRCKCIECDYLDTYTKYSVENEKARCKKCSELGEIKE